MHYPIEKAMADVFGYTDEQYDALVCTTMNKLIDTETNFTHDELFLFHELVWREVKRRRMTAKSPDGHEVVSLGGGTSGTLSTVPKVAVLEQVRKFKKESIFHLGTRLVEATDYCTESTKNFSLTKKEAQLLDEALNLLQDEVVYNIKHPDATFETPQDRDPELYG
jgi:hypothetical protein